MSIVYDIFYAEYVKKHAPFRICLSDPVLQLCQIAIEYWTG